MKLLELCLSQGFGGLELYAEKVIRHYHGTDKSCIPVVSRKSLLDNRLTQANIPHVYSKVLNQYFPIFAAWRLAWLCNREKVTTIHIHWRKDFPLAVFTKMLCHHPVRLVYTRQMALTRIKNDWYHQFLYRHVDCYLTITKNLENEAKRYLPLTPNKIHVLYYGVPEKNQPDKATCMNYLAEHQLQQEEFKVGLFGRIEYGKGQHLLVEAISTLVSEGKHIQGAIIGHVMDQAYFQDLQASVVNAGIGKNIRFCGFHPEPTKIMGCFDVVVLASYAETFGLVLPEAMRAGTAVVGTNSGGVPEIIQDGFTGLLFKPGSAAELAICLRKLMDDTELHKKISQQGKVYADEKFSEETHFTLLNDYLSGNS